MPLSITKCLLAFVCAFMFFYTFSGLANHAFELDDFRHLDDSRFVAKNPSAFFSAEKIHPGRPTMEAIFFMVWFVCGDNPAVFHLLSVVLHGVAAVLLAWVFFKMGHNAKLSALGACLFLFNVAHFRAIHWIACLGFLLAFILGLISVLVFLRALESPTKKVQYAFFSSLTLGVGICAHASIVSTFLFCMYLAWKKTRDIKQLALLCLPQMGVALLCVMLLYSFYPQVPQSAHFEQLQEGKMLASFWHFVWLLGRLWTTSHWLFINLDAVHLIDLIVGGGMLVVLGVLIRLQRAVSDWALWTLISLLPFVAYPEQTWLLAGPSRYFYAASAGSSFVLAWLIYEGVSFCSRQYSQAVGRVVCVGFLTGILFLSVLAHKRSEAITFYLSGQNYLNRQNISQSAALMQLAVLQDVGILRNDRALLNLTFVVSYATGDVFFDLLESKLVRDPNIQELRFLTGVAGFLHADVSKQVIGRYRIEDVFLNGIDQLGYAFILSSLGNSFRHSDNPYQATRIYDLVLALNAAHDEQVRDTKKVLP